MAFGLGTGMRERTQVSRSDELRVFPDRAGVVVGLARLPGGAARSQFGVGQCHVDGALLRIDDDAVTVAEQANRTANCRLRSDMADAKAAGGAGEAAVGNQRHLIAHALTVNR